MELIRYIHNLKPHHQGCVVTIGNFDGVHLGHQAVIQQLKDYAKDMGLPAVVVTFEPQPLEYFSAETAPARLTSFREKIEWLNQHGIERVVCLRFQASLAALSAEQFVEKLLVKGLAVKRIVVGDDFRFGKGRKGTYQSLQSFGVRYGFDVVSTETLIMQGDRVSSSRIRDALKEGSLQEARALLGRPYCMSGRVVHGDKRGRELGFPTANISLNRRMSPLLGIYAVRVEGLAEESLDGVAYIGTRPVFDGKRLLLEVHLLDYSEEIYGQHLQVKFYKRLRSEMKFDSVDQLRTQIDRDIEHARDYLSKR